MRIPFPLALSIGTDIVLQSRIARFVSERPDRLQSFTRRLLQQAELGDLARRFPKWREAHLQDSSEQERIATWLSGRWAAKEAAKKAWAASLLSFRDLKVERSPDGDVQIICSLESLTTQDQIEQAGKLTISHDGGYAIAVVLATPLHPKIRSELGRRTAEAERAVEA